MDSADISTHPTTYPPHPCRLVWRIAQRHTKETTSRSSSSTSESESESERERARARARASARAGVRARARARLRVRARGRAEVKARARAKTGVRRAKARVRARAREGSARVLSTSGLSHYSHPNPPLTGLTLATRHENLYPSLSCPPAPPPRPPPSPFTMRYHRRSLVHSVECPTKFMTSWYTQSCDVLFHAPRGGRAARYRENRAVQPSRTPDKKHANGAVCRPLPKKKQGQQKETTPLCPSANSSAPHAQQIPKTVALVLRCRVEMLTIVEVKAWSRRPAI